MAIFTCGAPCARVSVACATTKHTHTHQKQKNKEPTTTSMTVAYSHQNLGCALHTRALTHSLNHTLKPFAHLHRTTGRTRTGAPTPAQATTAHLEHATHFSPTLVCDTRMHHTRSAPPTQTRGAMAIAGEDRQRGASSIHYGRALARSLSLSLRLYLSHCRSR